VVQGIFLLLISFCPEEKKDMVPWCTERYISIGNPPCSDKPPLALMVDTEVDAVDFEPEEDDLMDDDIMMDDVNADVVPTPTPKFKSTITGGTSQLDDGIPNKTKGRGFRKENDIECNSHFAARDFESLNSDGIPLPQRCILSFNF
jgi:hypothetical protein